VPSGTASRHWLYRHVIPVVGHGWTEAEPVPLWISSPSNSEQIDGWIMELRNELPERITARVVDHAGRKPGFRRESAWQRAVRDAERRHGLTSHPRAPIVSWEPEEEWKPSF